MKNGYVDDDYRTNPESLRPGGSVVCVRQENGQVFKYDKVKSPYAYVKAVKERNPAINAWWMDNTPDVVNNI